ncbi:MAG: 30S ribosomal protein S14 [Lysobacteraceae bacterium]|nr:MAG: 30S ribosomal protein S14 [Xanthomonadaceae bacterium]
MAKTSMVNRDIKRKKLVKKFAARRTDLKTIITSVTASYEEKMAAVDKLQKLPRDSSPSRVTNRCALTGRSRGVYAKFGLGRNKLREATMRGDVPGLRKASW